MIRSGAIFTVFCILSNLSISPARGDQTGESSVSGMGGRYQEEVRRSNLELGAGVSQISRGRKTLSGQGFNLGFGHAFMNRFHLHASLSQMMLIGSMSSFYTGVNATASYVLFGEAVPAERVLSQDGKVIYREIVRRDSSLRVGLGLEQLFLNGAQASYPASGVALSMCYVIPAMNQWFGVNSRLSFMSANGQPAELFQLGVSVLFQL